MINQINLKYMHNIQFGNKDYFKMQSEKLDYKIIITVVSHKRPTHGRLVKAQQSLLKLIKERTMFK